MQHPREAYVTEIERCNGNLRKAAFALGLVPQSVYNAVNRYELWPVVNAARAKRIKAEPASPMLVKARQILKG